jgi:hypothetical protein
MSKINPLQAAALSAPTKKVVPAKAAVSKPTAAKPAVAKAATTKPVVTKAVTTKPVAAKPAAAVSITKVTPKKVVKAAAVKTKPAKAEKLPKLKMERDSFTMPKVEYAQFSVLKERLIKLGQPAKKSELLRAGIMQLTAMTDAALKAAMTKVPTIKTGRPNKK